MTREEVILREFGNVGAFITNTHVVFTSGRHGDAYLNKDAVYPHTELTSRLCFMLAEQFEKDEVETVIAPALGGIILSVWVAHHLTTLNRRQVHSTFAEKMPDGSFVIGRGYDKFIRGKRVLAVEDVFTTGGSAEEVVEVARAIGGNIIGVGGLCNRGGVTVRNVGNVPKLFTLTNVELNSWPEEECPLCKAGIPINTAVGKGRQFLEKMRCERA